MRRASASLAAAAPDPLEREAAVDAYSEFLDLNGSGEAAERVRRILRQVAPDLLPPETPAVPPPAPAPEAAGEAEEPGEEQEP